ncbi:MAG: rhodanese-like domain-containing protein [Chloroflexota bacterium]
MMMTNESAAAALPPVLTAAELEQAQRAGELTLVDVRSPAEFQSVHIPGSYNVPLDLLSEHRAELCDIGTPVVLVCRSGMRARQAEQALLAAGAPRLHVLDGGVSAWEQAGLAVRRGRQAWSIERQVRAIAGGLVLLGALGSVLLWQPLLYLAMFVGAGLLFAGVTDTCAMGLMLARMPWNRSVATCDVSSVLAQLKAEGAATGVRA